MPKTAELQGNKTLFYHSNRWISFFWDRTKNKPETKTKLENFLRCSQWQLQTFSVPSFFGNVCAGYYYFYSDCHSGGRATQTGFHFVCYCYCCRMHCCSPCCCGSPLLNMFDTDTRGISPPIPIKKLVRRIALLSVKMCCVYDMCAVSRLVCVDIKSHSNQELI